MGKVDPEPTEMFLSGNVCNFLALQLLMVHVLVGKLKADFLHPIWKCPMGCPLNIILLLGFLLGT